MSLHLHSGLPTYWRLGGGSDDRGDAASGSG